MGYNWDAEGESGILFSEQRTVILRYIASPQQGIGKAQDDGFLVEENMEDKSYYTVYTEAELVRGIGNFNDGLEKMAALEDYLLEEFEYMGGKVLRCDNCQSYYPYFVDLMDELVCPFCEHEFSAPDTEEIEEYIDGKLNEVDTEEEIEEEEKPINPIIEAELERANKDRLAREENRKDTKRLEQERLKCGYDSKSIVGEKRPGFVYLMIAENGLYKIGRARNVQNRLTMLNRDIPYKTELVHHFASANYIKAELYMHEKFSKERVKYEWFNLSQDQIDWIRSLTDYQVDNFYSGVQ
jgi:uncharacterized Zn finger protein (UPF0148 family)